MAIYAVAKLGGICNMVHAQTPAAALRENMAFTESDILITYLPDCTGTAKTTLFVDLSHHMGLFYRAGFRLKSRSRRPAGVRPFEAMERGCETKAVLPEQGSLAEKCAVYFHSSGTTGTPKTVMHCHEALNNSVESSFENYFLLDAKGKNILSILPLYHGSGLVKDLHLGLSGGGQITLMAKWDCDLAVKWIKKQKITNIAGVPAIFWALLKNDRFSRSDLQQCYVGGDRVGEGIKLAFLERTGIPLLENYGLTETVSICCGERVIEGRIFGMSPYPGYTISILSSDNIPTPHGTGELIISCNTMMMGYLNDSAATEDALTNRNERVWIRTGDVGTIDDNGHIHFLDRLKRIIIHNGYNVYPQEVESVIAALPEVEDVCAFGSYDDQKHTQIVCACVVLAKGTEKNEANARINAECEKELPHYAIPRRLYFVGQLPRNDMSKVSMEKLEELLREV